MAFDSSKTFSPANTAILLVVVLYVGSLIHRVIYNLYQHPLRHIPGPRLAAATYLYQTYFAFKDGKSRYYIKVAELHKQYGDAVRITPDEVHFVKPEHYDVIYSLGHKYSKVTPFYSALGAGYSTFTSGPTEVHRPRRARLDPFFSRRNVLKMEYLVQSRAEKLLKIIKTRFARGQAVDLHHAFRSISVDVISDYAFGKSYSLLDREDLGKEFFDLTGGIGASWWVFQQWPAIQAFALSLPPAVAKAMNSSMRHILTLMDQSLEQVLAVKAKLDRGEKMDRPVIFEALLAPAEGYEIPTPDQIKDESYAVLNAASDTTGNALTVAAYHVVNDAEIYRTLTTELETAFPDPNQELEFLKLEKLPYLTAVIKEGLRLSVGAPGRLPRVVPAGGVTLGDHHIPAGSYVSMSVWDMHHNEDIFPDPTVFKPTRWIDAKDPRKLDKGFVPFSKGSRACAGINLAYCELYITLGTLFRHFKTLKSNKLTDEDRAYNDYFSAQTPLDATKFHVTDGSAVKA